MQLTLKNKFSSAREETSVKTGSLEQSIESLLSNVERGVKYVELIKKYEDFKDVVKSS